MGIDAALQRYVEKTEYRHALGLPAEVTERYEMLAQGEYNVNYAFVHPLTGEKLVLRINQGSQMHLKDQIGYEANALGLIEDSGRTPRVLYVDSSIESTGNGCLVMNYLPGSALDYTDPEQLRGAAECLADIHSVRVTRDSVLIDPGSPLEAILNECEEMVSVYMESPLADRSLKLKIRDLLDLAWRFVRQRRDAAPYQCCINTELNSTNFLAAPDKVRLVDWEKPLYGDPAQDLGHFLAPTTTFWKTDVFFDADTMEQFIDHYIEAVDGRFDTHGLRARTERFVTVTCLRGVTWCAMAWVQYREADKELMNESTRRKLDQYISDDFIDYITGYVTQRAVAGGHE